MTEPDPPKNFKEIFDEMFASRLGPQTLNGQIDDIKMYLAQIELGLGRIERILDASKGNSNQAVLKEIRNALYVIIGGIIFISWRLS